MPKIFAALDEGGRPLLARVYGGVPPPSFPTVALLSGLVTYGEGVGVLLRQIATSDARIVFKRFGETLLALVTNDQARHELHLEYSLELAYNAVVLLAGQEALEGPDGALPMPDSAQRDVDAVKKVFRGAPAALIDFLLKEEPRPLCLEFQVPEVAPMQASSRAALEVALRGFAADAVGDDNGVAAALAWKGTFLAATAQWQQQHSQDILLIQALIRATPPAVMRDIPVYLPNGRPNVPLRLLTADLTEGIELLILAGPSPALSDLPELVTKHMGPVEGVLKNVAYAMELPASNAFQGLEGIDALLVVQREPSRCMQLTCDVSAMTPGSNPFVESQEKRQQQAGQQGALGVASSLVSFALCMSAMVPVGGAQEAEDDDGRGEFTSIPKRSDAYGVQMTTPGHCLVHVESRGGGLKLYAALPLASAGAEAEIMANKALAMLPTLIPM